MGSRHEGPECRGDTQCREAHAWQPPVLRYGETRHPGPSQGGRTEEEEVEVLLESINMTSLPANAEVLAGRLLEGEGRTCVFIQEHSTKSAKAQGLRGWAKCIQAWLDVGPVQEAFDTSVGGLGCLAKGITVLACAPAMPAFAARQAEGRVRRYALAMPNGLAIRIINIYVGPVAMQKVEALQANEEIAGGDPRGACCMRQ